MILFPHLSTPEITLVPVPFRSGPEVFQQLAETDEPGLVHPDLFTALYCPREPQLVAMQFEVRTTAADEVVGCSTLVQLDAHAGHVRAAVFVLPGAGDRAAGHARLLTVNYAFASWDLRKVYSWQVHGQQPWPEPLAVTEGTLRGFLHDGSRNLDMDVLALYRRTWDEHGAGRVEQVTGGTARQAT